MRRYSSAPARAQPRAACSKDDLRDKESGKIECGKAHFRALAVGDNPARYVVATKFDDLMASGEP